MEIGPLEATLKRQEVDEVIVNKVLRFAQSKETFTIKELFAAYPDNPEAYLRYAVVNLRIDGKLFMFGNKRGAYYSCSPGAIKQGESQEETDQNNSEVKTKVLASIKKVTGWFKRPQLEGLDEYYPQQIIGALKELVEDGICETQGSFRWTEYRLKNSNASILEPPPKPSNGKVLEAKEIVLAFIKEQKVTTVPIIIDRLKLARYVVVQALEQLEDEEEIYHEGIKRSSKYIHKDVSTSEVEDISDTLREQRRISSIVDELSAFMENHECGAVSCTNRGDCYSIRFFVDGIMKNELRYETLDKMLHGIMSLTEVKD